MFQESKATVLVYSPTLLRSGPDKNSQSSKWRSEIEMEEMSHHSWKEELTHQCLLEVVETSRGPFGLLQRKSTGLAESYHYAVLEGSAPSRRGGTSE
ncbi:hypothetical protein FNV43_RR24162 [Rhamnella rubrinervis]|uniref:Uncharacterized protein n=1 Tax=Rhamnella rubrinervis TaxID=2594499 RepID=A0A8K0GSW5_9ROSA|nr:hypothetical protein FNV43_RR24162 [Rhamnella rubrinervis]